MTEYQTTLENTIDGVEKLRSILKRNKSIQVRSIDEKTIIKATALAWFNKQRVSLLNVLDEPALSGIDHLFNSILTLSDKLGTRKKFDKLFKEIKKSLTSLRAEKIAQLSSTPKISNSNDKPPNFLSLVGDKEMVLILEKRWDECIACVNANAPLAATVMMGGLLESLLLSKFLQHPDKKIIFKTKAVPKDKITGSPLQFKEWVLRNYIEVAHELNWISQTEKDISEVLRDYRNYIHPFKEKSHGIKIEPKDSKVLWEITKSIARQIINSKIT